MFTRISKPEAIKIKPIMATNLLKMNTFTSQRNLNHQHVKRLTKEIEAGTFLTAVVATVKNGEGKEFLINGQHTLHAIIAAGQPVEVYFEKYQAETPEDVSNLFRKFDVNLPRSLGQIVKVEKDALNIGFSDRIASLVVSAAAIIENRRDAHKTEKVHLLKKYSEEGKFLSEIFTGDKISTSSHLMKSPVAAVMIRTWQKNHGAAMSFWIQVRDGEELKKKMPSYLLRNWLLQVSYNRGRGASIARFITANEHEIMYRCVVAWNAFRSSQNTALKYFADKSIPKAI